jgi:hypothetical protein
VRVAGLNREKSREMLEGEIGDREKDRRGRAAVRKEVLAGKKREGR